MPNECLGRDVGFRALAFRIQGSGFSGFRDSGCSFKLGILEDSIVYGDSEGVEEHICG